MSNEDTLMSKLIEETYTESVEKDQPNTLVDLRTYFEKKLNEIDFCSISDYIDQNFLSHFQLRYLESIGCYRLSFQEFVLDFPSNWSVFGEVKNTDLIYVDHSLDQDFLLDVISEVCGNIDSFVLVRESSKVELVLLPAENSHDHVKWMRNYFEKRNGVSESDKVAA